MSARPPSARPQISLRRALVAALAALFAGAGVARAEVIDFDPVADEVPAILDGAEMARYDALVQPTAGYGNASLSPDGKLGVLTRQGAYVVLDTESLALRPLDVGGAVLSGITWTSPTTFEAVEAARQEDRVTFAFSFIRVDAAAGTFAKVPAGTSPPGMVNYSTNLLRLPDGRVMIPMLMGPPGLSAAEAILTVERPTYDHRSPEERAVAGEVDQPLQQAQVPLRLAAMDTAGGALVEIGAIPAGANPAMSLGTLRLRPGATRVAWLSGVSLPWNGKVINDRASRGGGMPNSYWNVQETLGRLRPEDNFHISRTALHLADLGGAETTTIPNLDHDPGKFSSLFWAGDGKTLAVVSQTPSVLKGRANPIYEYAAGVEIKRFSPDGQALGRWSRPGMDSLGNGFTALPGGSQVLVNYGKDTLRRLAIVDLLDDAKAPIPVYEGERLLSGATYAAGTLVAYLSSSADPGETFVGRQAAGGGAVTDLRAATDLNAAIRAASAIEVRPFTYTTSGGYELSGSFVHPRGWTFPPAAPQPAVVWQLGGPGGQMTAGWGTSVESPYSLLPNFGIPVVIVNGAGRTSNGAAFYSAMADGANYGQQDIKDVKEAVDHLVKLGWVNADAVGVTGCSYGGYFTLQSLATYPNTYRAGNAQCSLNDMMYEFNFGWSPFLAYLIGATPTSDPARYVEDSPFFQSSRIESPLLLFHGTRDFLFFEHITNIHDQVMANGVPARFFRPIGYGHGIGNIADQATGRAIPGSGAKAQRFAFQLQLDWFRRHLGLRPALAFDLAASRRYALERRFGAVELRLPRLTLPGLPPRLEVR